jgi:hypothetical protein
MDGMRCKDKNKVKLGPRRDLRALYNARLARARD